MATTVVDRPSPWPARVRAALTGQEWRRLGAMAAVITALHLIGWITLVFVVAPQHFSLGDKALGVGVGLTAYTLLGHAKVSMTQDTYMARGRSHAEVAGVLERGYKR